MKHIALIVALFACLGTAHAAKSCDELKAEITTKLDGKGVKGYTLEVVAADKAGDAKVVGSCSGGSKKIIYAKK